MATFKVGQRVRKVASRSDWPGSPHAVLVPIGTEGTICGQAAYRGGEYWLVDYDGYMVSELHRKFYPPYFYVRGDCLAPLTDPLADAFIESIRQLEPLKEPEVA